MSIWVLYCEVRRVLRCVVCVCVACSAFALRCVLCVVLCVVYDAYVCMCCGTRWWCCVMQVVEGGLMPKVIKNM